MNEKLKFLYTNKVFSERDILTLFISYEDFLEKDNNNNIDDCIENVAQIIQNLLVKGKLPGLNPVVDKIYEYKTVSNWIKSQKDATYIIEKLDNSRDYIKFTISMSILMGNIEPFLQDERIKIEKAEIQTALFRQEIR